MTILAIKHILTWERREVAEADHKSGEIVSSYRGIVQGSVVKRRPSYFILLHEKTGIFESKEANDAHRTRSL